MRGCSDYKKNFEEKVVYGKSPDDCWGWRGAKTPFGYGKMVYFRKLIGAHRVSYLLFVGPIPHGLLVCHKCDNPECANPMHLFLGTQKDNIDDMRKKGRAAIESRHPSAKLSERSVKRIRKVYIPRHPKYSYAALARHYGVAIETIRAAVSRKFWRSI